MPNVNVRSNSISDSDTFTVDEKYLPVANLFKERNEITRKDVEKFMKIKSTQAINILNEMLDEGIIEKIGIGKNTRYIKK